MDKEMQTLSVYAQGQQNERLTAKYSGLSTCALNHEVLCLSKCVKPINDIQCTSVFISCFSLPEKALIFLSSHGLPQNYWYIF